MVYAVCVGFVFDRGLHGIWLIAGYACSQLVVNWSLLFYGFDSRVRLNAGF